MKHMLQTAVLVLSLLLIFVGPINATDAEGSFLVWGYGTKSCGFYNEARRQPDQRDATNIATWLTGYITATNQLRLDTYDIAGSTDLAGMLGWMDNYCRANPTENIRKAAAKLAEFLYPNRRRTK